MGLLYDALPQRVQTGLLDAIGWAETNPMGEMAAGFVPGVGQAISAKDFAKARDQGSWGGMTLAGIGMIPGVGGLTRAPKALGVAGDISASRNMVRNPLPERIPVAGSLVPPRPLAAEGGKMYREANPESLRDLILAHWGNGSQSVGNQRIFVTDNPDLAIGQGRNKGAKIEFDGSRLSGDVHGKPGTGLLNNGNEYITDYVAPGSIRRIEIDKKSKTSKMVRRLLKDHFDGVEENGKYIFTPKN